MGTTTNRPLAIVTGSSSGIGFELAKQCVEHGFDVLICAEDARIEAAAERLRSAGTTVRQPGQEGRSGRGRQAGLRGDDEGKDSVIAASVKSKLQGLANEILPEPTKACVQAAQVKPGSGHKS